MTTRHTEIASSLRAVRARIERACLDADRSPDEVTLIVVTKYFPVRDVVVLINEGVRDFGENRDQEARSKFQEVRALGHDIRVHFIGQVQTNKAASVTAYADLIHSVDRHRLIPALAKGADRAGRTVDCLIQVDLDRRSVSDDRGRRGGALPGEVLPLADAIAECSPLRVRGVMTVAPLDEDRDSAFGRLADIAGGLRSAYPDATWISAGMSDDLDAAIRQGATHLRVGTAILGSRPPLR